MKKEFKQFDKQEAPPPAKATRQLVDAFCDTYQPARTENTADEVFSIRRIREFFQAWPMPKMPDPLPAYLDELEIRGYVMQTAYDGCPSIFCMRNGARGQICLAEEIEHDGMRMGEESIKELIARRMSNLSNRELTDKTSSEESWMDDEE